MKQAYYDLEDIKDNVIYGGLTVNQIRARLGVTKDNVHAGIYKQNLIKKRYRIHQSEYTEDFEDKNEEAFPLQFREDVENLWNEIQALFHGVVWAKELVVKRPKIVRFASNSMRYGG